jgi:hypothetical protein
MSELYRPWMPSTIPVTIYQLTQRHLNFQWLAQNLRLYVEVPWYKFVTSAQMLPHLQHLSLLYSVLRGQHHMTVLSTQECLGSSVNTKQNILLTLQPVLSLTSQIHRNHSTNRTRATFLKISKSEHKANKQFREWIIDTWVIQWHFPSASVTQHMIYL